MICELCNLDPNTLTDCKHPKNAYCGLYQKQAAQDNLLFGPKKYKTLAQLQTGDVFRYKGSEEDDWHTVSSIDAERLYYPGVLKSQSNYRSDNVLVIVKV